MKKTILIEGMHCSSCGSNIERSLKKIAGVKEATVSLMTRKGFVECADSVKDEDIKDAVKKAGYKALAVQSE